MPYFRFISCLLLITFATRSYSFHCRSLAQVTGGVDKDVASWLIITPPKLLHDANMPLYGFSYYEQADQQQDFSEEEVADASFSFSASTIEQMLLEPARQVAQLDETSPGVAVNMWFQNRYTLPGDVVDYSRLLYMKGKGYFQRDKNHYYVSHSKWIFTYNTNTQKGSMIMHSFTEIPEDLSKAHVFDRKDDSINNGRFEYAQFAFCFSFSGQNSLTTLIEAMNMVLPPIVYVNNLDAGIALGLKALLPKQLLKVYFDSVAEEAKRCYSEYYNRKDPLSCLSVGEIEDSAYSLFAKAPLPRLLPPKNDAKEHTPVDLDFLGCSLWHSIARYFGQSFALFGYGDGFANSPHRYLPYNMRDTDPEVIPVEAMALPATGLSTATWQWNKIHMEIGISSKENRVCFGDSPHMGALINRAGMGVCIKSESLFEQLDKVAYSFIPPPANGQIEVITERFNQMLESFQLVSQNKPVGEMSMSSGRSTKKPSMKNKQTPNSKKRKAEHEAHSTTANKRQRIMYDYIVEQKPSIINTKVEKPDGDSEPK